MIEKKKRFPIWIVILIGNIGFTYLVNLIVGYNEFQIIVLVPAALLFGGSLFLSLRIIYQMDKRNSRLKRRIGWFEPKSNDDQNE